MTTMNNEDPAGPSVHEPRGRDWPEPAAWARNLADPQPHCVTSLSYRSVADADANVRYVPLYTADQMRAYGEACAAAEREACHAIHDTLRDHYVAQGRPAIEDAMLFAALADYAAAIRARGETSMNTDASKSVGELADAPNVTNGEPITAPRWRDESAGVRCMCVATGCRSGPGCPHYCNHCRQHIEHEAGQARGET